MKIKIKNIQGDNSFLTLNFDLIDDKNQLLKSWNNVQLDRTIMDSKEKILKWCKQQAKSFEKHYHKVKNKQIDNIEKIKNELIDEYDI